MLLSSQIGLAIGLEDLAYPWSTTLSANLSTKEWTNKKLKINEKNKGGDLWYPWLCKNENDEFY